MKRRESGEAIRELRDKTSNLSVPEDLPLVHITAVGTGREIVACGQLEPRACHVFEHELAYFFLMRPAYKLQESLAKSNQISRFPLVFIVSTSKCETPYHVYPFDTGAAANGIFGNKPDPHVCLEDYELLPEIVDAVRHVGWAFGDLKNYFEGKIIENLIDDIPEHELATRSYISIAQMASSKYKSPDKRASCVEVSYDSNISINDSFIVFPQQFLESNNKVNQRFLDNLMDLKISWEVYDWRPNTYPEEYQRDIFDIIKDHYSKSELV